MDMSPPTTQKAAHNIHYLWWYQQPQLYVQDRNFPDFYISSSPISFVRQMIQANFLNKFP